MRHTTDNQTSKISFFFRLRYDSKWNFYIRIYYRATKSHTHTCSHTSMCDHYRRESNFRMEKNFNLMSLTRQINVFFYFGAVFRINKTVWQFEMNEIKLLLDIQQTRINSKFYKCAPKNVSFFSFIRTINQKNKYITTALVAPLSFCKSKNNKCMEREHSEFQSSTVQMQ